MLVQNELERLNSITHETSGEKSMIEHLSGNISTPLKSLKNYFGIGTDALNEPVLSNVISTAAVASRFNICNSGHKLPEDLTVVSTARFPSRASHSVVGKFRSCDKEKTFLEVEGHWLCIRELKHLSILYTQKLDGVVSAVQVISVPNVGEHKILCLTEQGRVVLLEWSGSLFKICLSVDYGSVCSVEIPENVFNYTSHIVANGFPIPMVESLYPSLMLAAATHNSTFYEQNENYFDETILAISEYQPEDISNDDYNMSIKNSQSNSEKAIILVEEENQLNDVNIKSCYIPKYAAIGCHPGIVCVIDLKQQPTKSQLSYRLLNRVLQHNLKKKKDFAEIQTQFSLLESGRSILNRLNPRKQNTMSAASGSNDNEQERNEQNNISEPINEDAFAEESAENRRSVNSSLSSPRVRPAHQSSAQDQSAPLDTRALRSAEKTIPILTEETALSEAIACGFGAPPPCDCTLALCQGDVLSLCWCQTFSNQTVLLLVLTRSNCFYYSDRPVDSTSSQPLDCSDKNDNSNYSLFIFEFPTQIEYNEGLPKIKSAILQITKLPPHFKWVQPLKTPNSFLLLGDNVGITFEVNTEECVLIMTSALLGKSDVELEDTLREHTAVSLISLEGRLELCRKNLSWMYFLGISVVVNVYEKNKTNSCVSSPQTTQVLHMSYTDSDVDIFSWSSVHCFSWIHLDKAFPALLICNGSENSFVFITFIKRNIQNLKDNALNWSENENIKGPSKSPSICLNAAIKSIGPVLKKFRPRKLIVLENKQIRSEFEVLLIGKNGSSWAKLKFCIEGETRVEHYLVESNAEFDHGSNLTYYPQARNDETSDKSFSSNISKLNMTEYVVLGTENSKHVDVLPLSTTYYGHSSKLCSLPLSENTFIQNSWVDQESNRVFFSLWNDKTLCFFCPNIFKTDEAYQHYLNDRSDKETTVWLCDLPCGFKNNEKSICIFVYNSYLIQVTERVIILSTCNCWSKSSHSILSNETSCKHALFPVVDGSSLIITSVVSQDNEWLSFLLSSDELCGVAVSSLTKSFSSSLRKVHFDLVYATRNETTRLGKILAAYNEESKKRIMAVSIDNDDSSGILLVIQLMNNSSPGATTLVRRIPVLCSPVALTFCAKDKFACFIYDGSYMFWTLDQIINDNISPKICAFKTIPGVIRFVTSFDSGIMIGSNGLYFIDSDSAECSMIHTKTFLPAPVNCIGLPHRKHPHALVILRDFTMYQVVVHTDAFNYPHRLRQTLSTSLSSVKTIVRHPLEHRIAFLLGTSEDTLGSKPTHVVALGFFLPSKGYSAGTTPAIQTSKKLQIIFRLPFVPKRVEDMIWLKPEEALETYFDKVNVKNSFDNVETLASEMPKSKKKFTLFKKRNGGPPSCCETDLEIKQDFLTTYEIPVCMDACEIQMKDQIILRHWLDTLSLPSSYQDVYLAVGTSVQLHRPSSTSKQECLAESRGRLLLFRVHTRFLIKIDDATQFSKEDPFLSSSSKQITLLCTFIQSNQFPNPFSSQVNSVVDNKINEEDDDQTLHCPGDLFVGSLTSGCLLKCFAYFEPVFTDKLFIYCCVPETPWVSGWIPADYLTLNDKGYPELFQQKLTLEILLNCQVPKALDLIVQELAMIRLHRTVTSVAFCPESSCLSFSAENIIYIANLDLNVCSIEYPNTSPLVPQVVSVKVLRNIVVGLQWSLPEPSSKQGFLLQAQAAVDSMELFCFDSTTYNCSRYAELSDLVIPTQTLKILSHSHGIMTGRDESVWILQLKKGLCSPTSCFVLEDTGVKIATVPKRSKCCILGCYGGVYKIETLNVGELDFNVLNAAKLLFEVQALLLFLSLPNYTLGYLFEWDWDVIAELFEIDAKKGPVADPADRYELEHILTELEYQTQKLMKKNAANKKKLDYLSFTTSISNDEPRSKKEMKNTELSYEEYEEKSDLMFSENAYDTEEPVLTQIEETINDDNHDQLKEDALSDISGEQIDQKHNVLIYKRLLDETHDDNASVQTLRSRLNSTFRSWVFNTTTRLLQLAKRRAAILSNPFAYNSLRRELFPLMSFYWLQRHASPELLRADGRPKYLTSRCPPKVRDCAEVRRYYTLLVNPRIVERTHRFALLRDLFLPTLKPAHRLPCLPKLPASRIIDLDLLNQLTTLSPTALREFRDLLLLLDLNQKPFSTVNENKVYYALRILNSHLQN